MQPIAAVAGLMLPGLIAPPARPIPARNSRRARAWREQLERTAGHALEQARSEAQRQQVEQAHAEAVARGPDWARIRRGSDFAKPVAVRDRNVLDKLIRWFSKLERETHAADVAWARHEQRTVKRTIPRTARGVLMALICLARKHSVVHPSIERLARMAQCCRRTAVSVLDVLEAIGLVTRTRRRKIIMTPMGPHAVQDTSAYQLVMPDGVGDQRPRPAQRARSIENAKSAQQSNLQSQPAIKTRAVDADRPPEEPPGILRRTPGDWRARSRASLEGAMARMRG